MLNKYTKHWSCLVRMLVVTLASKCTFAGNVCKAHLSHEVRMLCHSDPLRICKCSTQRLKTCQSMSRRSSRQIEQKEPCISNRTLLFHTFPICDEVDSRLFWVILHPTFWPCRIFQQRIDGPHAAKAAAHWTFCRWWQKIAESILSYSVKSEQEINKINKGFKQKWKQHERHGRQESRCHVWQVEGTARFWSQEE